MDEYLKKTKGIDYDKNGDIASSGNINKDIINQFYEHEKLSEIKDINHIRSKLYLINLFLTTSENVMFCLGMKPVEKM